MTVFRTALIVSALVLGACARQETTRTGFLHDYSAMAPSSGGSLAYRAAAGAAGYTAFIVDDVVYMPGAKSEALDETDIAALRAHFKSVAHTAFARDFRAVDSAGPGVLRVRLAITGIDKASAVLNYVTTPLAGPVSNGGASSEAEIVDSVSGVRLTALSTHSNATPFKGGLLGYYTKLGHAKSLLQRHAEQLRDQLAAAN
jgi:hypothetical protein